MADKVKSLGKMYKKDHNGKLYFNGTLMVENVKAAVAQGDTYTDKYGNLKIRLYVIENKFKQTEQDADYSVLIGQEPPTTAKVATAPDAGWGEPAPTPASTDDIPF